jgi:hypothetical protein
MDKFKVYWSFEDESTHTPIEISVEVYAKDEYEAEVVGQKLFESKGVDLYNIGLLFHESWIDEIVETKVGGEENE